MRLELFPFRFRDPLTGKWVRARYKAMQQELAERFAEFEIIGPPEIREVDPDARYFTPHASLRERWASPELQPPTLDALEVFLVRVFLRRYVTYCARRRRFASMNGAARLFADIPRQATDHQRATAPVEREAESR